MNEALQLIPYDAPVAAQNTIFPHLSQRRAVFEFPRVEQADYAVIDSNLPVSSHEREEGYDAAAQDLPGFQEIFDSRRRARVPEASVKVSVIIPALNEEAAIGRVVREIPRDLVQEIIVVDNGSTDGTAKAAREAGARVVSADAKGYGAACMAGVAAAPDADIYAFLDGDGSDIAARLPDLLRPVADGDAALALGLRSGRVEPGSMPWHQRLGNRIFVMLIWLLSGRRLRDLPSFKVIGAPALRSLDLQERTHGWTAELISKAAFRRLEIAEVETGYRRRLGKSKVSGTAKGSFLAFVRITRAIARSWFEVRRPTLAALGAVLGALAGVPVLAVSAIGLLSIEGTNYKVLAAVWLWALPVLAVCAVVGYCCGRVAGLFRRPGKASD